MPRKVFEINCGTGFDANEFTARGHKVTATDSSLEMIKQAKFNYPDIDFFQTDMKDIAQSDAFRQSNVLFSNFGGLNCLDREELDSLINSLSKAQTTKDWLIWVLMPKFCLTESLYFLFKLNFKAMFRRNTNKAVAVNVEDRPVNTYYYAPSEIKRKLRKHYKIKQIKPVAVFLPPSYTEQFFRKHPRLLKLLSILERIFGRFSILSSLSDHYMIIAERK